MILTALARAGALAAVLCTAAFVPALAMDEFDAMPDGPGKEDTYYNCIACHSFQVVTRQGMTRAMWDDTLTLMVERHGMFDLPEDERAVILEYLAEHYPAATPGDGGTGRRGWVNPFAN